MEQKIKTNRTFGQNLRKLRKSSGMTQETVVTKLQLLGLDISRSAYAQIECGTYNIKITELVALKEIFNASYDDFFNDINTEKITEN